MLASLLAILLPLSLPSRSDYPTGVFVVHRRYGHHVVDLSLTIKNFHSRGRKIVWDKLKMDEYLPAFERESKKVEFYGYEPFQAKEIAGVSTLRLLQSRNTEVTGMRISVDGRRWPVKHWMYEDLLDPHMDDWELVTQLSYDGKTLIAYEKGSVHGAMYWVKWTFRSDGRQSRTEDWPPRPVVEG
jgi:hypothetical protein